jgi:putative oxidoreductase
VKAGVFGKVTLWFATLVASALFIMTGTQKLAANPPHPTNFIGWGYPLWVMFFIGAVETTGAILLLIPRLASFGAAMISAVMIGAIVTHIVHAEWLALITPLTLLALVSLIGVSRFDLSPLRTLWTRRAQARA